VKPTGVNNHNYYDVVLIHVRHIYSISYRIWQFK